MVDFEFRIFEPFRSNARIEIFQNEMENKNRHFTVKMASAGSNTNVKMLASKRNMRPYSSSNN